MDTYEDSQDEIPFGHGFSTIRFRCVGPAMIFYFILQSAAICDCLCLRKICNRCLNNLQVNSDAASLENRLQFKRTVVITQALLPTLASFSVLYLISWIICLTGYCFANYDFEHRLLIAEIAVYNVFGIILSLFPIIVLCKLYTLPEVLNGIICVPPAKEDIGEQLRSDGALQRFKSLDEQWNYAYEKYKSQAASNLSQPGTSQKANENVEIYAA